MPVDQLAQNPEQILSFVYQLLVALALGALIGTQREMLQQKWSVKEFGGIRSFMILSLIGYLSAYLSQLFGYWLIGVLCGASSLFLLVSYTYKTFRAERVGVTSELAGLLTFFLGVLCSIHLFLGVIVGVISALIITLKNPIHKFILRLSEEEFLSTLEFLLFAFVILPLLPNHAIDQWGVFNPYKAWIVAVFILAISFAGYIISKILGPKRGILLTGILGGLFSSTAVTHAMSSKSSKNPKLSGLFIASTYSSSAVMCIRAGVVLGVLAPNILLHIFPALATLFLCMIGGVVWSYITTRKNTDQDEEVIVSDTSPFSLMSALRFALFFIFILFVSYFARLSFGSGGIYFTAIVTGLFDIDAFTLSMAQLVSGDRHLVELASLASMIAICSNMVVKAGIGVLFGSRAFKISIATSFVLASALALFVEFSF